MTTTTAQRRPGTALPLALGALAVATWIAASVLAVRRRAEEQRVAEVAAGTRTAVEAALGGVLRGLAIEARQAAELAPLQAALAHEVDVTTFRDLLASEEWWAPFRGRLVLVVSPAGRLIDSGPPAPALLDSKLVAGARARQPASAWLGGDPTVLAAAAVPVRRVGARPGGVHVLLLGRPLDQELLAGLAARLSLTLLASDGRQAGVFAGDGGKRAALAALVGGEPGGVRVSRGGRWLAVPLALRPSRWVWAMRDLPGRPPPPTWLAPGLLGLATASAAGAIGLWLRRGRRRRPAPRALDRPGGATPLPTAVQPRPPGAVAGGGAGAGAAQPTQILDGVAQVFGRYTLLERIGEGGMSELFTAVLSGAEGFHRLYVIKRLKPHIALNQAAVDQFIDEAKLGSLLVHSNIVPVFDFGKVGSGYFLAQEYIAGRNVSQIVERHQERLGEALGVRFALYIAHEVLEALAYAHSRSNDEGQWLNIVHRDVSSGNVMVTAQGEVKLFDFGIVSAVDRISSTEIGRIKGNAAFMSPEQARGQPVDARSDLFSLGMVMFTMVSGQCLYGTQNPAAAFYEATAGLNADHLARIRALPQPMPALLEKALAMEPGNRYPSARDFAEVVAPYTGGMKMEMATLMNALFGEDLRRQTVSFRAKLGQTLPAVQKGS